MAHWYSNKEAAAVNLLRYNLHMAGTCDAGSTWYYPPTVLDEDGRLWGSSVDHLNRVLENRAVIRHYYRSLLPDAPAPPLLGRAGHVVAVQSFAADLLTYYQPLLDKVDGYSTDLGAQTVFLMAEAKVLYNVALAMSQL